MMHIRECYAQYKEILEDIIILDLDFLESMFMHKPFVTYIVDVNQASQIKMVANSKNRGISQIAFFKELLMKLWFDISYLTNILVLCKVTAFTGFRVTIYTNKSKSLVVHTPEEERIGFEEFSLEFHALKKSKSIIILKKNIINDFLIFSFIQKKAILLEHKS